MSKSSGKAKRVFQAIGVLAVGLAGFALAVGLSGRSNAEGQMSGESLAEWLIAGAAANGQMNLKDQRPRYCFIKSFIIIDACIERCFKRPDVKVKLEYDMSDGYWFAASEVPGDQNSIFVSAIPQHLLVWDAAQDEMDPAFELAVEEFLTRGCGFADAVTIESKRGLPAIAAELPGIFAPDGTYQQMTPKLSNTRE